jgi:HK97 family phage prohead protease
MIERTTIDNRPALAAYINGEFEPTSADAATMVKITFTDEQGGVMFLVPADVKAAQDRARLEGKEYEEDKHPRDDHGRWTDSGGSEGSAGSDGDKDSSKDKGTHPGPGYSSAARLRDGVIYTPSVYDAQRALFEDRKVELDQEKKISTLIRRLGETAAEMAAHGEKAPNFNLCNVSVSGTNLFCADTKGIPRIKMPQMDEVTTKNFRKYLKEQGYTVEKGRERSINLRASQNELVGTKVAAKVAKMKAKGQDEIKNRLIISKDDYIVDGHHKWATQLALDAEKGKLDNGHKKRLARTNTAFSGARPFKIHGLPKIRIVRRSAAMPMTPNQDEKQSDFMARCMKETFTGDRTQEQAVAICTGYWNDAKGSDKTDKNGKPQRKQYDDGDMPEPDDDEGEDDFVERCVSELTDNGVDEDEAQTACEMQWEDYRDERASAAPHTRSADDLVHKTHAGTVNGMEFVLSDESVDRMGDVIASDGWDLRSFKRNPIALFNHNSNFPIGTWEELRVEKGALRSRLKLAPEGTSPRCDEIRKLVEAGILRATSVGFKPIESSPRKSGGSVTGEHFTRQELVETSLVSIPANPNALAVAKSLQISPSTINLVFAGQGRKHTRLERRGLTGGQADTSRNRRSIAMSSLAQRIIDLEASIIEKKDELAEHWATNDNTNVSDTALQKAADLNTAINSMERQRAVLLDSEKIQAGTSENKGNGSNGSARSRALATTALTLPHGTEAPNVGEKSGERAIIFGARNKKQEDVVDMIVRAATILLVAKVWNLPTDQVREKAYGPEGYRPQSAEYREGLKTMCDIVLRAASAPALTTVVGWAAELVQQVYQDLLPLLLPKAILTRLSAMGMALGFGRAGRIIIPMRSRTPTIAGSFVGEGQPIPVRQGAFTSQTLIPKKLAVISTWSKEMDDHSIPAIEGVIREAIQEDTTIAVDSILLDANPATVIRPAGLLNGVAALTPTAGGGLTALIGDIKQLVGAIAAGTYGNIRNPAWLMNPQEINSIAYATAATTGIFPFREEVISGKLGTYPIIDSGTVPLKTVILIDAADFVVVGGESPRFELSDQASLHMEDTAPAELVAAGSPGVVAAPQRSLFQTDSLALRMVMPLNWVQRRAGTIAWVNNVTW